MNISPGMVKALTDMTGEPRIDIAIREIIRDAVEHRMERLQKEIEHLTEKYQMRFEEFDREFQAKEIPEQFSYDIEKDYLEWEGLISRRRKLEDILQMVG